MAFRDIIDAAAVQLLRLVPGSWARRVRRDLRDAQWLSRANVVIISFPKSGRTFVRAMLSRLFQRRFGIDERRLLEFPMLLKATGEVPRLLFTHAGDAMRTAHEIDLDAREYEHCRVVLLARHPGDVAVSRYHHLKHRSRDRARRRLAGQPLESFVWAAQGGIPSIVAFLNRFAALPELTVLRYEDFIGKPEQSLGRLARTIGVNAGKADIDDAVRFGSVPSLKQREREGYFTSSRLRRARKSDDRSGKVRSGTSGGYRAELDADTAAAIDAYLFENLDPRFGYSGGS